ncbi:MAG: hypothetical protein U0936_27155 [Planctomycetaceae bacterium]
MSMGQYVGPMMAQSVTNWKSDGTAAGTAQEGYSHWQWFYTVQFWLLTDD